MECFHYYGLEQLSKVLEDYLAGFAYDEPSLISEKQEEI